MFLAVKVNLSLVFDEIRVCLRMLLRRCTRLVLVVLPGLRTAGGTPPGHILCEILLYS